MEIIYDEAPAKSVESSLITTGIYLSGANSQIANIAINIEAKLPPNPPQISPNPDSVAKVGELVCTG